MTTNADIAYLGAFGIEGVTPGTYVDAAEVVSITTPEWTRDRVEATHLKSPDRHKEYVPALFDTGAVNLTLNLVPANAAVLTTAAAAVDGGKYRITVPGVGTIDFTGCFTALSFGDLTADGKMEASATVERTTGRAVFTAV